MAFENFFIDESVKEFEIDGAKFGYKPTTGGDETDWNNDLITMDPSTGKVTQDFAGLNKLKLTRNLKIVPWDRETIKNISGIDQEWTNLNEKQRWKLLRKLSSKKMDVLMQQIHRLDNPNEKELKNSSGSSPTQILNVDSTSKTEDK